MSCVHLSSSIENGLNQTLFIHALKLRSAGFGEPQALSVLHQWIESFRGRFHRSVRPGEVERQVTSAYRSTPQTGSYTRKTAPRRRPAFTDKIKVEANVVEIQKLQDAMVDFTVESLTAESPLTAPGTATILRTLFAGHELICAGFSLYSCRTRTLCEWLSDTDVSCLSFTIPNAMRAKEGRSKEGKVSQRCLENSGPRKRLVIECDRPDTPLDYQAGMLWVLSIFHPLEMVVNTAGKSLHGWFHCFDEAETQQLFVKARILGADPALWMACQPARMPGGLRYPKPGDPDCPPRRQRVIYYNPMATRGGIYGAQRKGVL
jgi:hypothetical protein